MTSKPPLTLAPRDPQTERSAPIDPAAPPPHAAEDAAAATVVRGAREIGGRDGPDPTRFGDWELRGRCIDF